MTKAPRYETLTLEKIVGGGQALGTLDDGRKCFVWDGLPGERVAVAITKKKSKLVKGIVETVIQPSTERIAPRDPDSYLSTSPWQIMSFAAEQRIKAQLIDDAFRLHHVELPTPSTIFSDGVDYGYRNKVEFSWYGETDATSGGDTLHLAFFRRGGRGKIPVDGTSLARPEINVAARTVRDFLQSRANSARQLKTLLVRANQHGDVVWQLYVRETDTSWSALLDEFAQLTANSVIRGAEIIYSDPRSPASRITERLAQFGNTTLTDTLLGTPFRYTCEGFFQINLPVYEQALGDMAQWVSDQPTLDLYSGVGTIGLTIGRRDVTLVEINDDAVREMRRNITELGRDATADAVLAASEKALDYITADKIIIVDPPRAGLHADVIDRLLDQLPPRIIYLSCNPVTQARDVALLLENYAITHTKGYNFFPRTPHIEHLVVLDRQS